jgi:hypothetical protein
MPGKEQTRSGRWARRPAGVLSGILRIRDARGGGKERKQKGEPKGEHSFSGSNGITKADLAPTGGRSAVGMAKYLWQGYALGVKYSAKFHFIQGGSHVEAFPDCLRLGADRR